jgi:NAD(P)-dependent dehydrogenase (short-subunit alcohol dehydrogenase family)
MAKPNYPVPAPPVTSLLDLSGRVAIVTGAGSGLGIGVAQRFARAGAAVVVHYHTSGRGAKEVACTITAEGGKATVVQGDLTIKGGAEALLAGALAAFGRVDVLVNNAGLYRETALLEMNETDWDLVVDANLRTVFLATQAAARQMIAQGDGGAIVNVASIEGSNPAPGHTHYDAAKGAVIMHTRAAAQELAPHGIRVNVVSPGLIWSEGIEQTWADGVDRWHRRAPLGRMGMPEDVADACLFLASAGARWITGANLVVDGGMLIRHAY